MRVGIVLISTTLALSLTACSGDQQAEEPVEVQEQQEQEEEVQDNAEPSALELGEDSGVSIEDAEIADDAPVSSDIDAAIQDSFTDGPIETASADEEPLSNFAAATSSMAPSMVSQESDISDESAEAFPGEVMWVNVNIANVRSQPSLNAPVVSKLKYGARVPVHGRLNGWIRIGEGKHLSITVVSKTDPYWHKRDALHFVTSPDLNIRAQPEFGSTIIGRLTKGEVVAVRKRFPNGWVEIDDGRYVNGAFLSRKRPNFHHQALSH